MSGPRPPRRRLSASRTGKAVAGRGGYANSGIHIGDVTVAQPARSRYLEEVRALAPEQLVGRARELDELADFCAPDPEPEEGYLWWQADAWTGKSALMSWFVLHPPPGVRVVSFFVTSRYSAQNNADAFVRTVVEQLADLLGEPLPAAGHIHLRGLLREAAEACVRAGERLVLVVDGLDEDHNVDGTGDVHSIAALLPASPPAGMRVVVASRLNPSLPADVPDDHPLRDASVTRRLGPSLEAKVVRVDMERELRRLMKGSPEERDLLGLVVAAGGGLSAADLAELTDRPRRQVDEHLTSVLGRSYRPRPAQWEPGAVVYLLGHEELQVEALEFLADELDGLHGRLHAWADRYRQRFWPQDTPEYLLNGYFGLLVRLGDVDRMVDCATDARRYGTLLDLSGGDAIGLSEIDRTRRALIHRAEPDLGALTRLAVHRSHLAWRNDAVPERLPALLARLGHESIAESLALSIPDASRRGNAIRALRDKVLPAAQAPSPQPVPWPEASTDTWSRVLSLLEYVHQAAYRGAQDDMRTGAYEILREAPSLRFNRGSRALEALASHLAEGSEWHFAMQIVEEITDDAHRVAALTRIAEHCAARDEQEVAEGIALHAADIARVEFPATAVFPLLTDAMRAAADIGDTESMNDLAHCGTFISSRITDDAERVITLTTLATAARGCAEVVTSLTSGVEQWFADDHLGPKLHAQVVRALIAGGDLGAAEAAAAGITDPLHAANVGTDLAHVAARAGDLGQVARLVDRVERVFDAIPAYWDPEAQLVKLVAVWAAAGDVTRGAAVAARIATPYHRVKAWAEMATHSEDPERARDFAERSCAVMRTIETRGQQGNGLSWVAGAFGAVGDFERALSLAEEGHELERAWIAFDLARLPESAMHADRISGLAATRRDRALVFAHLAATHVSVDFGRPAEALADGIDDPDRWAEVLATVARRVPVMRRRLVVELLGSDRWTVGLPALARTSHRAFRLVIEEVGGLLQ
ncbi:P-loop domain-containing protein [Saccharothrix stipae]